MIYVATFFSHHEAVQFARKLKGLGISAKMLPVPRRVSSSCGTGVQFEGNAELDIAPLADEGTDKIFLLERDAYRAVYINGGEE